MSLATVEGFSRSGVPLPRYAYTCDACKQAVRYSDTGALPFGWRALDTWRSQAHTVEHLCETCEKKSHAEPPSQAPPSRLGLYLAIALILGLALFSIARRWFL